MCSMNSSNHRNMLRGHLSDVNERSIMPVYPHLCSDVRTNSNINLVDCVRVCLRHKLCMVCMLLTNSRCATLLMLFINCLYYIQKNHFKDFKTIFPLKCFQNISKVLIHFESRLKHFRFENVFKIFDNFQNA